MQIALSTHAPVHTEHREQVVATDSSSNHAHTRLLLTAAPVLPCPQIQWHSIDLDRHTVGPLLVEHAALLGAALRRPDLFAALDADAKPDVAVALVMTVLAFVGRDKRKASKFTVLDEVSVAADYCLRCGFRQTVVHVASCSTSQILRGGCSCHDAHWPLQRA